jgi:hypothetical protein
MHGHTHTMHAYRQARALCGQPPFGINKTLVGLLQQDEDVLLVPRCFYACECMSGCTINSGSEMSVRAKIRGLARQGKLACILLRTTTHLAHKQTTPHTNTTSTGRAAR